MCRVLPSTVMPVFFFLYIYTHSLIRWINPYSWSMHRSSWNHFLCRNKKERWRVPTRVTAQCKETSKGFRFRTNKQTKQKSSMWQYIIYIQYRWNWCRLSSVTATQTEDEGGRRLLQLPRQMQDGAKINQPKAKTQRSTNIPAPPIQNCNIYPPPPLKTPNRVLYCTAGLLKETKTDLHSHL